MAYNKELAAIVSELKRQGWAVTENGASHYRAVPPNKEHSPITFSHTGDPHGRLNMIRDLRKRGFVWPPPEQDERTAARRAEAKAKVAEEEAAYLAPAEATVIAPFSPVEPVSEERQLDIAYEELKHAKAFHKLALEHLTECDAALAAAQERRDRAHKDSLDAAAELTRLKAAFDALYTAA